MFLNRLSGEQKELFLDLSIYASKADGIFAEEEKQYIQQYCNEMQLGQVRYSAQSDLDSVIKKIVEVSTINDLKIILFEIAALVLADNDFAVNEKDFLDRLVQAFNLEVSFKDAVVDELKKLTQIYDHLHYLILG